ncbi:MAG: acyl-CoA desaturase [Gammaproteobacteria bacterium]|nr:acyl-CoA desaturase [Gammaproteobacteria bacterium]
MNVDAPTAGAVVTLTRPQVLRLQQAIALSTVVFPFLGAILAGVLWFRNGIGAVEITSLIAMYLVCMLGVTVGLHRLFAHRSFKTGRAMQALLAVAGSMAAQGPVLFWVSTHRRHHQHSDREGDPHSPNLHGDGLKGTARGLWFAHIGWMFDGNLADVGHYAKDVLRDRMLLRIHQSYLLWVFLGLLLPALAGGLLTGTCEGAFLAFLWGGLVRVFLVNHASWCVGSVCHRFGTRPFATQDRSANNYTVAVLAFGEGLQNNHHAFPASYRHAMHWWQPDLSAWVICLMKYIGLAWELRAPSAQDIHNARAR